MKENNNQREGSKSNSDVGKKFEAVAKKYFKNKGWDLTSDFKLTTGLERKKEHAFDLGSENKKVIVECKSHKWTKGNNIPSAKITLWNEAMYYFHLVSEDYKKIFFTIKDLNKSNTSLVEHYLKNHYHLIPKNVYFYEYDEIENICKEVDPKIGYEK